MELTEHDKGSRSGIKIAAIETLRIVRAHIDRLEPGKQKTVRDALESLEGALYAALVVRNGLRDEISFDD